MVVESAELLKVTVRGYGLHVYEGIHVFGNNNLFIAKLLLENFDCLLIICRGQGKSSDGIKGSVVKE